MSTYSNSLASTNKEYNEELMDEGSLPNLPGSVVSVPSETISGSLTSENIDEPIDDQINDIQDVQESQTDEFQNSQIDDTTGLKSQLEEEAPISEMEEPESVIQEPSAVEEEEEPVSEQLTEGDYIPSASMTEIPESKQMVKDDKIVKDASSFRTKISKTKKKLPSMDDHQKDEIRNGVIREFINILKISKHATTRKKFGKKLNNLRNVFHDTLNMLNGTSKKRPRRKSRKQKQEMVSEPIAAEV
jgi:hypothetical protein